MTYEHLLERIAHFETAEDSAEVRALLNEYADQPTTMVAQLHEAWQAYQRRLDLLIGPATTLILELVDVLMLRGVAYPLTEWITLKAYSEQVNVAVNTLMNWISRGIVPVDHINEIPQLGIKLIKAVRALQPTYLRAQGEC